MVGRLEVAGLLLNKLNNFFLSPLPSDRRSFFFPSPESTRSGGVSDILEMAPREQQGDQRLGGACSESTKAGFEEQKAARRGPGERKN
jgi:hypothetical protein